MNNLLKFIIVFYGIIFISIGAYAGSIENNFYSGEDMLSGTSPYRVLKRVGGELLPVKAGDDICLSTGTNCLSTAGGGSGLTASQFDVTVPLTLATTSSHALFGITLADTSTDGYLSSTDWNTFNGKVEFTTIAELNALLLGESIASTTGAISPVTVNDLALSSTGFFTNVAVGSSALSNSGAGFWNNAVGMNALKDMDTGSSNNAFGFDSLESNTVYSNSAFGHSTLTNNIVGAYNLALGSNAGKYEVGSSTLYINTQDQTNTAGDKAYSLLYGQFSETAGSLTGQQLTVNGQMNMDNASSTSLTVTGNSYLGIVKTGTWNGTAIDFSDYTNATADTGIKFTDDAIGFDCSEVEGVGINCATEAITLDATGDWTGTLDTYDGITLLNWDFSTTTLDYWFDNTAGITGNTNIVTVGTIGTGSWEGTAIDFGTYTNATASNGIQINGDNIEPDTGYTIPLTASTTEYDNLVTRVTTKCYPFASSTAIVSGHIADIGAMPYSIEVVGQRGIVNNGTSLAMFLSDGTNDMTTLTATTSYTTLIPSTNTTWVKDEPIKIEFSTNTGTVTAGSYCIDFLITD